MLIRPHAWWLNKVPLSVVLVSLLLASHPLTGRGGLSLVLVVVIVSCAANYGYGLNELFDRDEDARAGRHNVATQRGGRIVWLATASSAVVGVVLAGYGAGLPGVVATLLELALPATYSIPPIRTKERRWLAVVSDATAAHIYPAALALLILAHQDVRSFPVSLVVAVLVWAAATGLRGILSHLVWSLEHDRAAGLATIAHSTGARRLAAGILGALLPLEVISFTVLLVICRPGLVLAAIAVAYVVNEVRRSLTPRIQKSFAAGYEGRVFQPVTNHYVPFVDEKFYKLWGPIFVPVSAAVATGSAWYLGVSALYVLLFWPRIRTVSWRSI